MNVKRLLIPVVAVTVLTGVVTAYQHAPIKPAQGQGGYTQMTTADAATWVQGQHLLFGSQAAQLAQQLVKTDKEDDRRELRRKLSEALNKEFEQHAERQGKEIEALEKQIKELKSLLDKRQEAKSSIVERRMEQLIDEAKGLGWNAPGGPRSGFGGFYPSTMSPFGTAPATVAPAGSPAKGSGSR